MVQLVLIVECCKVFKGDQSTCSSNFDRWLLIPQRYVSMTIRVVPVAILILLTTSFFPCVPPLLKASFIPSTILPSTIKESYLRPLPPPHAPKTTTHFKIPPSLHNTQIYTALDRSGLASSHWLKPDIPSRGDSYSISATQRLRFLSSVLEGVWGTRADA